VGDVVVKSNNEVGARNIRKLAALYTDSSSSGFEVKSIVPLYLSIVSLFS